MGSSVYDNLIHVFKIRFYTEVGINKQSKPAATARSKIPVHPTKLDRGKGPCASVGPWLVHVESERGDLDKMEEMERIALHEAHGLHVTVSLRALSSSPTWQLSYLRDQTPIPLALLHHEPDIDGHR